MSTIHVAHGERAHNTRHGIILVKHGSLIDRLLMLRLRWHRS